jgi:hypothetical protein
MLAPTNMAAEKMAAMTAETLERLEALENMLISFRLETAFSLHCEDV